MLYGCTFFHVDAFTREPGKGNASGVYLLAGRSSYEPSGAGESSFFQAMAAERNLPETGFVRKTPSGFSLRWFTPCTELSLCGHGTLAAAHVLWEQGWLTTAETLRFQTCSGELKVRYQEGGWIEMEFPTFPLEEATLPPLVASSFDPLPKEIYVAHDRYLVVLDTEAEVRDFKPDFSKLKNDRVVITAAASGNGASDGSEAYDFVSRTFAVPVGVDEDPVTGSSHCALTPYWSRVLGKSSLRAYQASARGGHLRVRQAGEKVFVAGQAVTVSSSVHPLSEDHFVQNQ